MQLRSISLVDYQSHQRTNLELGPLTVIVGSSSSGKSAVVRAIRLVAQNARGTDYVRHGQKRARISLELAADHSADSTVVAIDRGRGVSEYELIEPGSEAVVFTKCSTSTPETLSNLMGLGDPKLWLAGQFDRPFLLDETGSAVAQVLGRLTNVTMIYAAVRECNRRVLDLKRRYKDQAAELVEVRSELRQYASLPSRLAAGREAESALNRATALSERRYRLADLSLSVDDGARRLDSARIAVCSVPAVDRLVALSSRRERLGTCLRDVASASSRRSAVTAMLRQVPDNQNFVRLVTRRTSLSSVLSKVDSATEIRSNLRDQLATTLSNLSDARGQFEEVLKSAGNCPLCGADAAHAQISNVV